MNYPIDSVEIAISLDYLKQLDGEISDFYHLVENDESISDEKWRVFEKKFDRLFSLIGKIEKEI